MRRGQFDPGLAYHQRTIPGLVRFIIAAYNRAAETRSSSDDAASLESSSRDGTETWRVEDPSMSIELVCERRNVVLSGSRAGEKCWWKARE